MGRKKIDKTTLEYMINHLFRKNDLIGFQFTAGNTPLGLKEKRPLYMSCSLNFSRSSVVIDCMETDVRRKITSEIFNTEKYIVTKKMIKELQKQFKELGYEVHEAKFAGYWYSFIVHCTADEIIGHVNNLKSNLGVVNT